MYKAAYQEHKFSLCIFFLLGFDVLHYSICDTSMLLGGGGDEKRGQFFSHFSGVTKKGVQLTFYSIFRWGGGMLAAMVLGKRIVKSVRVFN